MKKIIMCLLLLATMSTTVQAEPCYKKLNRIQVKLGYPTTIQFNKYLCVYFRDQIWIERAMIIVALESGYRNITSDSGDDHTYFQFHKDTIKNYGLDAEYLQHNLFYQFHSFERIMKDKLEQCAKMSVPEACWHSKTKHHYLRYKKNYLRVRSVVRQFL